MTVRTALGLIRHFGPAWVAYRAWRAVARRTGLLTRRMPQRSWGDVRLAQLTAAPQAGNPGLLAAQLREGGRFFFAPDEREAFRPVLNGYDDIDWASEGLEELASGRVRLFSGAPRDVGWPPRWHTNPLTGEKSATNRHFSRISEFEGGDVKGIWELSRFGFAFDLVRIYWRNGDDRCPAMFWEAVEDWRRHNPPNTGVNWKCGQESSLRALAWCFGLWGFLDAPTTTPERVVSLVEMLAFTARRVEADIGYGLSQKNNHGISEATGLLTIGLLFPMLRDAARWARRGRELLERQGRDLVYVDGGFSQYSANYHRLMLDDYVWAIRLADIAGRPLSDELIERVARAGRYLAEIQDRSTGRVPRYGHDDGAHLLALSPCPYDDYRPAVQATAALADQLLPLEPGPWNEKLVWLFGADAAERSVSPTLAGDTWKDSGYGSLRRADNFVVMRGGHFLHRPAQADLLHVDLWWRGRNVALDPGTYSYNAEREWASIPLGGTACHNTVGVDGRDQADRVSRFLYLRWPAASRRRQLRSSGGHIGLLELELDGYLRLDDPVRHRRAIVQIGAEHWLVADRLDGTTEHDYRLHWLLVDAPYLFDAQRIALSLEFGDVRYGCRVVASESVGATVVRAQKDSPRGWYAPRYEELAPALSLAVAARTASVRFFTILGPGTWTSAVEDDTLRIGHTSWRAEVDIAPIGASGLLGPIRLHGGVSDELDPA